MGWFSKVLYRETDTVSTAAELEGCFKGIGFTVEKDEFFRDADELFEKPVMIERFKIARKGFKLTVIWDGKVVTFLQKIDVDQEPLFLAYQQFHLHRRYLVLTYGGPDQTVIVKHTLYMSIECPVVAASIERVLNIWETETSVSLAAISNGTGGQRRA